MHTNNVVEISHASTDRALPRDGDEHDHQQVVASRNGYRRRYERRTVALALARAEIRGLRMKVAALEQARAAGLSGPVAMPLPEAIRQLLEAAANRRHAKSAAAQSVRFPAGTLDLTSEGATLVQAAQLLPLAESSTP